MARVLLGAAALAAVVLLPFAAAAQITDTGQQNPEVLRTNGQISMWADTVVDFVRGPLDHADPSLGLASFGSPTDVLGDAGSPCSLGDGGSITLGFPEHVVDGPGVDFVVFENAFAFGGEVFAELAFVEVSSDGASFVRMPAISRIDRTIGAFEGIASTETYNLAGNHVGGTAFDLADLADHPLVVAGDVDLEAITYVRVVDVIGDCANGSSFDVLGNAVCDPYPTASASGGFDLTGVAVMNPPGPVSADRASFGSLKARFGDR